MKTTSIRIEVDDGLEAVPERVDVRGVGVPTTPTPYPSPSVAGIVDGRR
jgi:hypothetical protein